MKKVVLLSIAVIYTASLAAQMGKVASAKIFLDEFASTRDAETLKKAMEAINQAAVHEKTKDDAKTFVYKGQIYSTSFDNALRTNIDKLTSVSDPNKKSEEAYKKSGTEDLEIAADAFKKAKELDLKNKYAKEISDGNELVAYHFSNKGIVDYNSGKYSESFKSYKMVYSIKGEKDTSIISNCAIVAANAKMYDEAIIFYQKLIDVKAGGSKAYKFLVNLYFEKKDSVKGLEALSKGRAIFPNDLELLTTETNYFLKTNSTEKALSNLNKAIEAQSGDATLYFARGTMYDNMANPKDEKGNDKPKPQNYNELLLAAEKDYKKAIEIKSDYFNSLFNLGALYFNDGVYIINRASDIRDITKQRSEEEKANIQFRKSLAPMEKAHELNPSDRATLISLKQAYTRLQMKDKLNAINEKLK